MKKRSDRRSTEQSKHDTDARDATRSGSLFDARVIRLVLAVKALVLLFGAQAYVVSSNQSLDSLYEWLAIWNRWDAPHYLDIAREGYVSTGVEARWIVFYPLYPWLVRAFALVLRDELIGAFVVSGLASIAAALLLYRLARLDDADETAQRAVVFMLIFPTAYFLHIGYTESLFLALAVGAFLAARGRRWWIAGLLGALACMTRVNGLLLVPALALEAFDEHRNEKRRWRWQWLWIAFACAGFGVYLLINFWTHGDALAFLHTQEAFWYKSITWPWVGIIGAWNALWSRAPSEAQMVGGQELLFVALGLGFTIWSWARLRASYAVWMSLNWLLWTSTKFVLSVPRYTLVMFPIYILLARATRERRGLRAAIAVWSLLLFALFVTRFVQGFWAF